MAACGEQHEGILLLTWPIVLIDRPRLLIIAQTRDDREEQGAKQRNTDKSRRFHYFPL
jgi:hypothetical protein